MLNTLEEFEEYADTEIAKLALWRQPIRSVLSLIYLSADAQYVGARFNRKRPRNDEVGTAMITRMSYVARHFGDCSREIGADIDDALSVVDDRFQRDIGHLLGYRTTKLLTLVAGNRYVSALAARHT